MKTSSYDPKADPLMPRLFRKFDPNKSTIISAKRGASVSAEGSHVQKYNNFKTYKVGQGYGSQRTYMCINPYRSMSKNKIFASQMKSLAHDDTERALYYLEESYQMNGGKKLAQGKKLFEYKGLSLNEQSVHGGESKLSSNEIGTTELNLALEQKSSVNGQSPLSLPKINRR